MATIYKFEFTFGTADGGTTTMKIPYANTDQGATQVNNFMNAIITNGSIFAKVPVSKKSAKLVKTEETTFVLDE